jgi:type IV pilus assembly protein PilA
MKGSRGFTLIELMVVIAIIAILASLAITAYTISISKSQLSEAFTLADGLKADVLDYRHQTGLCPMMGTPSAGLASNPVSYSGKYVANATIASQQNGCVITIRMRNATVTSPLRGKQVVFAMDSSSDGAMRWSCSSDAATQYLPATCR